MSYTDSMQQTITVQSPKAGAAGSDAGGNPVYDAQRTGSARVEFKQRKIVMPDKSVVSANWHVMTTVATTINDLVWLPGTDVTNPQLARRWLNVEAVVDGNGATVFYQGDI
jgi:hypothetical protein